MINSFFHKYSCIFVLLFLCSEFFALDVKYEDFSVSKSLKNVNFGGHTATVEESGVFFEKCSNGEIVVSSAVGPGLITLKNCHNVSVVLESGACLLLDNKTELDSLYIKENARLESLEVFQAEFKNKKITLKKKACVKELFVESGFTPVLSNINIEIQREIQPAVNSSENHRKLRITQDKWYRGLGVRFIIENCPKDADSLNVLLVKNGVEEEIDWISRERNKEAYYSGFYVYEFLDAGKEYEFVFWYGKKTETLAKYYIKAIPAKGTDLVIDKAGVVLNIDAEKGIVFWDSVPSEELPSGTQLVYDLISYDSTYNWHYVGSYSTERDDFSSVNIYEDMKWHFPENLIDNKAFLHVFYRYKTYRWPIMVTPEFGIKTEKR